MLFSAEKWNVGYLQNHNIMEPFQAHNIPGPLLFVDDSAKGRSFFQG
jgi:hypothetical protein